jgi:pimeloyl-ACP methyl ester carboxylesterase
MTLHSPSYISGFISIAGPLQMDTESIREAFYPLVGSLRASVLDPDLKADALQRILINFVSSLSLSDALSRRPTYEAILGTTMMVPMSLLGKQIQRSQDDTNLMKAAVSGEVPLLKIYGAKDKLYNGVGDTLRYKEWKRITVVELSEGDHVPWISVKEEFHQAVFKWIGNVVELKV